MPGFLGGLNTYDPNAYGLTPITPYTGGGDFVPAGQQLQGLNITPYGSGGGSGFMGIDGIGANIDTLKLGLGGLQAIGNLWSASQQNKLAKKAFNLQSGILNTNLANQIKDYNLGIDDKFRSRAVVEGTSAADRDAAIAKWQATDQRKG